MRSMGGGDSVRSLGSEGVKGGTSETSTKHKKGKGFRKGKSDKKSRDSSSNVGDCDDQSMS